MVSVKCENFVLGTAGRHWHLYVDGQQAKAIQDGSSEAVLRGVAPGKHEIAVYLAQGERRQLVHGVMATIFVAEPNAAKSTGMRGP